MPKRERQRGEDDDFNSQEPRADKSLGVYNFQALSPNDGEQKVSFRVMTLILCLAR